MGKWNIKAPDRFPARYAVMVQRAVEQYLRTHEEVTLPMGDVGDYQAMRRAADDFRHWRKMIRMHPAYHLFAVERDYKLSTRAKPIGNGIWTLSLHVYRKPDPAEFAAILSK